ncbi:TetR family transcriptional regulator [Streptomyces sp. NPDC002306]
MKQERAAHTRQALIHSAAQAFEQHGYTRANLTDISTNAGVSTGALHFHFTSKADLATTLETTAAHLLRTTAATAQQPDTDPLQQLINTTHALAHTLRHNTIARAGYHLNSETPHHTTLDLRTEWQQCIHHHLTQATTHHHTHHTNPHHLTTTTTPRPPLGRVSKVDLRCERTPFRGWRPAAAFPTLVTYRRRGAQTWRRAQNRRRHRYRSGGRSWTRSGCWS